MVQDRLRRAVLPIIALVVAPVVLISMAIGGLGVVGLAGYAAVFFMMALWDMFAAWRAVGNRMARPGGLKSPLGLVVMTAYVLVFFVWGPGVIYMWGSTRALWALTYLAAALVTVYQLWKAPSTRRFRHDLFAVYNVLGAMAVGAWALADAGSPGVFPLTVAVQGWGVTQALLFSWGAFFAPILFLPPLLVYEPRVARTEEEGHQVSVDPATGVVRVAGGVGETEGTMSKATPPSSAQRRKRGPLRRVASPALDVLLGGFVVVMLVFNVTGVINVTSWNGTEDPEKAVYGRNDDMAFAAVGRSFTDRRHVVDGHDDVVEQEIKFAKELGLDYIRYDLHQELIDDESEMELLSSAIADMRSEGLDVILCPFGSARWEGDPPALDELVAEIQRETYLLVETFEPAWVFPFFEPNGQVRVNLGDFAPVEDWMRIIDETGRGVRERSNRTRVLIEVAVEPQQGLDLVRALSEPGREVDAIGVDLYPLSLSDLDKLVPYRAAATNDQLEFWISEFGVESLMSGHGGQARALSEVLVRATNGLRADGVCVWSLLDDTVLPSNLGLVCRNGEPKEAYRVMGDAIGRIRGL